jgi:hypothetical protein
MGVPIFRGTGGPPVVTVRRDAMRRSTAAHGRAAHATKNGHTQLESRCEICFQQRMTCDRMTGLRADIVPHREWGIRRWFYANPIWYYHRPSAAHEICTTGKFYQLVDPELREVCHLLNDAGVRTTPSCQGHSYPRERFEKIWNELKSEEQQIRTTGLLVKDSENDQPYLFQEPQYIAPWTEFETFYSEARSHQNIGYLGIIVPAGSEMMARLLESIDISGSQCAISRDEELGEILGGILISVRVNAIDAQSRSGIWQQFTDQVRDVIPRVPYFQSSASTEGTACKHAG